MNQRLEIAASKSKGDSVSAGILVYTFFHKIALLDVITAMRSFQEFTNRFLSILLKFSQPNHQC